MQRRSVLQQHRRSPRINEIPRPLQADARVAVLIAKYDDTFALILAQDRLAQGVPDVIGAVEAQIEDVHLHTQAASKESQGLANSKVRRAAVDDNKVFRIIGALAFRDLLRSYVVFVSLLILGHDERDTTYPPSKPDSISFRDAWKEVGCAEDYGVAYVDWSQATEARYRSFQTLVEHGDQLYPVIDVHKRAHRLTIGLVSDQRSQHTWYLDLLAREDSKRQLYRLGRHRLEILGALDQDVDGSGGRGGHATRVPDDQIMHKDMLSRFVDAVVVLVRDVEPDDFQSIDARIGARTKMSIVDLDLDPTVSTTGLLLVSSCSRQMETSCPHNSRSACAQVLGWLVSPPAATSTAPSMMV
ncbi:hypothetical protein PG985_003626 [Apiospora marii]|uniref:Uncharacterized protein n=1 Tax=Apiospora marii TaxID=335849 RepID=A0ABR1SJ99_9PEZI